MSSLRRPSSSAAPLPMTLAEVTARGWDAVDVVFVTGDAYVDHPSFAMALLGRVLEAEGFRVAILSQPDWHSCDPWRTFGRPRLCFAISAGNMDSMLNNYTAARKVRNDDAYSPGGQAGRRPDRATLAYCQRAREAYRGVPIIAGGVEASLRRLAHYDYWSDKVRRSILLDAKPDLLVFGMGERPLVEIVRRLAAGESLRQLRNIRGAAYRLGASETQGAREKADALDAVSPPSPLGLSPSLSDSVLLPSYESVSTDRAAFAKMTRIIHEETNPDSARRLVQFHGREAVVVNPPALPLDEQEIDRIYGLPFTRQPHPSYGRQRIPAFEVVKDSIQIMRGCFGGCAFCSITLHEGRVIQSRSQTSVLDEIHRIAQQPGFSGFISDLGGPTANMYRMGCTDPQRRAKCRRLSCLWPAICPRLATDHAPLLQLLEAARQQPGVRQALVASGIRMDLAIRCPAYIRDIARHHTGGLLKVAPEHCHAEVLRRMHKPGIDQFEAFTKQFHDESAAAGKRQFLVPYFIAGHPGCDLLAMIDLALYLKRHGLKPDKVQDFIPAPMDIATCMYHTGLDPMTGEPVYVARGARERRLQRALLQYFKPENYADVRAALEEAGRPDLIGDGHHCLIPSRPPRTAPRSATARTSRRGPDTPSAGYRPHRKTAKRRHY
ncbi:MAG: YgiQ family radical SAM protein [Planctomycetaceae bacterium]|nr:YgiQ family radical SAM protein [Planctomycetaceae bacterium]